MRPSNAAQASQALLSLHDAGLKLGRTQVLTSVNLSLHRGERLALVGSNGSGKTSLLRLLHGLVPCSHGRRELPGLSGAPGLGAGESSATKERRGQRQSPFQRQSPVRLAMVFQKPFVLNLSTQANVRLALWLQGLPAAERAERCALALARVGLSGQARQRASTLSGGQQQRLALARAWAVTPEVLLMDEPTASLDPGAKREVEALMESLAADGLTLVFSTHNLGQVKRLATRVVYLEAGEIRADAPVAAFFDPAQPNAATPFLKAELGW